MFLGSGENGDDSDYEPDTKMETNGTEVETNPVNGSSRAPDIDNKVADFLAVINQSYFVRSCNLIEIWMSLLLYENRCRV